MNLIGDNEIFESAFGKMNTLDPLSAFNMNS